MQGSRRRPIFKHICLNSCSNPKPTEEEEYRVLVWNWCWMGAAFAKDSTIPVCSSSNSFDDVPENCISIVLMFLEPPEICKLAALNRAFRAASSADFIWNSKLPSNYAVLLCRILPPCSSDIDYRRLPKKEIFARLSRPNLFDRGTKVTNYRISCALCVGGGFRSFKSPLFLCVS